MRMTVGAWGLLLITLHGAAWAAEGDEQGAASQAADEAFRVLVNHRLLKQIAGGAEQARSLWKAAAALGNETAVTSADKSSVVGELTNGSMGEGAPGAKARRKISWDWRTGGTAHISVAWPS